MNFRVVAIAVSVLVTACATRAEVRSGSATKFAAALTGHWRGVLEYEDYQPPHRQVVLPTTLHAEARPGDEVVLAFEFDDGPSKKVRSRDVVSLNLERREFRWGDEGQDAAKVAVYRVVDWAEHDGSIRVVVERDGDDDDAPALIHQELTVTPTSLTIVKTVTPPRGEAHVRHQYRFNRDGDSPPRL